MKYGDTPETGLENVLMMLRLLGCNAMTPKPANVVVEAGFVPCAIVSSSGTDSAGSLKPSQDVVDFKAFLAKYSDNKNQSDHQGARSNKMKTAKAPEPEAEDEDRVSQIEERRPEEQAEKKIS